MSSLPRRSIRALQNLHDRIRRPQQLNLAGKTAFSVVTQTDAVTVRHYPAQGAGAPKQPVVVVPPLAVNMLIYDLFPDRSLVGHLAQAGHPVYLIDWGRPTRKEAHLRLSSYIEGYLPKLLEAIRAHAGVRRLSLHGWSLGAVFVTSYAALGDADIDKLVLLGAPCDYHAKSLGPQNRLLAKQFLRLEARTGWQVHQSPAALWHVPGWANALGFKLLSPGGTMRGYLELLRKLHDRDYVASHATNGAFLDDMVAYPGGAMQDILRYLVTENRLAHGRLPLPHSTATLANVRAQVLLVVGKQDPIVTPAASKKLIEQMPHAPCTLLPVKGGHMSIVSGSHAPTEIWPAVAQFLAA